jgi:hypothetical protein
LLHWHKKKFSLKSQENNGYINSSTYLENFESSNLRFLYGDMKTKETKKAQFSHTHKTQKYDPKKKNYIFNEMWKNLLFQIAFSKVMQMNKSFHESLFLEILFR